MSWKAYARGYFLVRDIQASLLVLVLLALVVFISFDKEASQSSVVVLSDQAEQHILYGDYKGGGHLYGVGKPCKSEFPESWSAKKVIDTVSRQASNDNIVWRQESNGYHVSDKMHENVKVRVVLDDDRSHIITAYPTNQSRNPCNFK